MSENLLHRPRGADMIFVFGSNEAGIPGAGAALYARRHCGAETCLGFGNSFATPTKDHSIKALQLVKVSGYVKNIRRVSQKPTRLPI